MSYTIKTLQNISSIIYKPFSITIDVNDNIYILQKFYRRIIKVNKYGNLIETIGVSDNIPGDELKEVYGTREGWDILQWAK